MPTSRIPESTLNCFGLFALTQSTRTILPLKGVECDFTVISGVVEVSMRQIFRQDNKQALNCEYLFPLPANASVYCCEADINGRTIRAQVREREEARQLAAEKKAEGFRTALVESERDNLFTLSLGNVQPQDLVIIQLKYFQTPRVLAGKPSIEIPFCPGVRYIPGKPLLRSNQGKGTADDTDQVPDASRITPVRIDNEHPDAAYIDVRGILDGRFIAEHDLVSPSHSLEVNRAGEELRVALSNKGEVPDRDFVLRWSEKTTAAIESRAWIRQTEKDSYALLEIRAPESAAGERGPVDFYFLVDRSGSMAGEKWEKAAEALLSCTKVLGTNDRVMVTLFESQWQDFSERPLLAREVFADKQFRTLKQVGTGGGTELEPALKHVLELAQRHSAGRLRNLILITDAQIGNEPAILELMKRAREFPVHCFGIDVALNDSLLLALCRQQGGTFHSLHPNDDIEQAVTSLGKKLAQPVLLDLRLSEGWETADASIPNLYAGQVHHVSVRASVLQSPLEIKGRSGAGQPLQIPFTVQKTNSAAPFLHWHRSRIQQCLAEGKNPEAIALSVASNLICPLTAFIAWDESEKVPVASHDLVQPCMELYDLAAPAARSLRFHSGAALAKALSSSENLFRETLFRKVWGKVELIDSVDGLRRELSDICHREGINDWEIVIKAIFDWIAEAKGAERQERLKALRILVDQLKAYQTLEGVHRPNKPRLADGTRENIHRILKVFVDTLPKVAAKP